MKKYLLVSLFLIGVIVAHSQTKSDCTWENLPKAELPVFKPDTFRILKYGAMADGITLNTVAIQKAIDECSQKGGGVVFLSEGLWLSGPIELRSNVNLHLGKNAVLLFSSDFDLYPLVEGNFEGKPSYRNQSPISGHHLTNIAITGQGIIDGNGDSWRMVNRNQLTESGWKKKISSGGLVGEDGNTWFPSVKSKKGRETINAGQIVEGKVAQDYANVKDFLRPNLLVLSECKKILLEGVTFQNSPAWCLHPLLCEDLTLKGVKARNPEYAQNGDGIDVESCRNVLIEDCLFDVGDDGICIKSGKDAYGRKRGVPTENMVIRNNTVYKAHGGFVVGSEMSGGVRNIFVTDCLFMGTDKGIRFKTARGRGGTVENIYIRNILMKDIQHEAIYFDMYYFTKPPVAGEKIVVPEVSEETPQFQRIRISNVICNGADKGIFIRGLPEMAVKDISITNSVLSTRIGVEMIESDGIVLKNIRLITKETNPVIAIENSSSLVLDSVEYNKNSELLLKISGNRCGNINALHLNMAHAKKSAEFGPNTPTGILKIH